MNQAKKVFTMYGKHANVVTYEYRGKQYDVEYANDWTYCVSPAKVQHEIAQEKIDKQIAEEEAQKDKEPHPVDLDEIWELLGWD